VIWNAAILRGVQHHSALRTLRVSGSPGVAEAFHDHESHDVKKLAGFVALVVALWTAIPLAVQSPRPILILVSIDGFRWDYFDRAAAPNLKALAARGVRSVGLIP
jgi:hypothetical protein